MNNRFLLGCALVAALYGCSAGETKKGGEGGSGNAGGQGGAPTSDNGYGGAEEGTHPLFGAGSYTSVDMSDPCNSSPFWEVGISLDLKAGLIVIYEGTLWKITGSDAADNYTMAVCTPPGTDWCADKYLWVEVGTCPIAE